MTEASSARPPASARFINPETVHPPFGYSHVVEVTAGRPVYIAGQVALDPTGALVGADDIRAQTRQVFDNLRDGAVGEVTMPEAVPEPALANVLDYVAAWNEPDAATRLKILERCWADDGAYVDPNVELRGQSALCEHISKVQAGRPGARLEMMSGVELHHHVVRFLWRLVRADGRAGETSIDVGEVDADGRLTKIVGFFGEPPKR